MHRSFRGSKLLQEPKVEVNIYRLRVLPCMMFYSELKNRNITQNAAFKRTDI